LKDMCVLVTGASEGTGWALSRRLADLGCYVVGIASQAQEIDFPGYLYECDVADAGATEEVLRAIRDRFPVDAVVNNVTVTSAQALGEVGLSEIYQGLDASVRVATQVSQGFIESMRARRAGRIVNLCNGTGWGASAGTVHAAAVILDAQQNMVALLFGLQHNASRARLAFGRSHIRQFNAVVYRVAHQMHQRVGECFHKIFIQRGVFTNQLQRNLFAQGSCHIAHLPWKAAKDFFNRLHARFHHRVLQVGGD